MNFELLLDAILGERQVFYIIECPVCGFEEIYYENRTAKKLIGRACSHCQFIQRFDEQIVSPVKKTRIVASP